MRTIRPDKPESLSARVDAPQIGSIILRFVALLVVAIVVLLLLWAR